MLELQFDSNEQYLAEEFRALQVRLDGRAAVRDGASTLDEYSALVSQQRAERPALALARKRTAEAGVSIPFQNLAQRFELSSSQEEVLLCCLAAHLSNPVWERLLYAQGSIYKPFLTVGFLAELLQPNSSLVTDCTWASATAPLVANHLITIDPSHREGTPAGILAHYVHMPHYIAAWISGEQTIDKRLTSSCTLHMPKVALADLVVDERSRLVAHDIVLGLSNMSGEQANKSWTLLVSGPPLSGKSSLIEGLAHALERPLLRVRLQALSAQPEVRELLTLLFQNAQFHQAVLHLDRPQEFLERKPEQKGVLLDGLNSFRGLTVLEPSRVEELDPELEPIFNFALKLERPGAAERECLWESMIPADADLASDLDLGRLAEEFEFVGGQIALAVEWALQRCHAPGGGRLGQADLLAGAKTQVRSKIELFTDVASSNLKMPDLILSETVSSEVRDLLAACRSRHQVLHDWGFRDALSSGRGMTALFTGAPGTGKTLCAQILANELGLKLFIVAVPKLVSKWVGETEKNIREVFGQARASNSVLLFDEADSLFTTRVRVERAQDTYQNMEVNTLLQEVERFEGIVLLTTNLEINMDRAFERRILFKIDFPFPEDAERARLWDALIPSATPRQGRFDNEILAVAFELSGGQIKNAILRAAFRCAAEGQMLTQTALEIAAHEQARSAGLLVPPLDQLKAQRTKGLTLVPDDS